MGRGQGQPFYNQNIEVNLLVSYDNIDRVLLDLCIARLLAIVKNSNGIRITVTDDFVKTVREKIEDQDYANEYEQDRKFGFAPAKTITQSNGTIDLIFDSLLLSSDSGLQPDEPQRTFEHEAYHIAIERRGESLNDIRLRHKPESSAHGQYLASAGVACEEFRVEAALWRDYPSERSDSHLAGFSYTVDRLVTVLNESYNKYEKDHDLNDLCRAVATAFHAVVTSTGYIAAEIKATNGARWPVVEEQLDEALLGEPWRKVVEEMSKLPEADVASSRPELDAQVYVVAEHLFSWLRHIGFIMEDTKDNQIHLTIVKDLQ